MPDTKKFPQPATAPDGLANALPDVPVCDPDCHGEPDIVARLRSDLPDDEVLYDLSELFRVFGDTTRIKILYALFESELCRQTALDIKRLSEIGCYRGMRHRKSLPVRGQRSKTNARTRKGPKKTIANKKK